MDYFGILFAEAMDAIVIGMSHSDKKKYVALELGCDAFINTSNTESMAAYKNKLNIILCTGMGQDFECKWFHNYQCGTS